MVTNKDDQKALSLFFEHPRPWTQLERWGEFSQDDQIFVMATFLEKLATTVDQLNKLEPKDVQFFAKKKHLESEIYRVETTLAQLQAVSDHSLRGQIRRIVHLKRTLLDEID